MAIIVELVEMELFGLKFTMIEMFVEARAHKF
jgi:hypothetical protein